MRRLFILATAVLLLAAPATVSADHGPDSARGRGTLFLQLEVDFSARSTSTGQSASGHATFKNTIFDPNATWRGEVTCLRVVGATATTPATFYLVARVTAAPPGSLDQSIHVFGTDSGKFAGAPDTLEAFTDPAPPNPDGTCPTTFPFGSRPLADGEVVVHNTLP